MTPLDDDRLTLAGLLFEAHHGLSEALERGLRVECGLPAQWFEVLLRLARTPGQSLRMSELASQTTLTPSGLTRVVDRLEQEGLVRRRACPTDRRGAFAELTAEGRRRIDTAVPAHLAHLEQHLAGIYSAEERGVLEGLLRRLRDHVHPGAATGA